MRGQIPVLLVSGFLGSGKTTLLRHLASALVEQRLVFLVNEFANKGVDPLLLRSTGLPLIAVEGGSLLCRCRSADFIRHMRKLVELREDGTVEVDLLVIETSGMTDPNGMSTLLKESRLDAYFEVRETLVVVVPGQWIRLQKVLPVLNEQVMGATRVIINKCDVSPESEIAETIQAIRELRRDVPIERVSYGKVALEGPGVPPAIEEGILSVSPGSYVACEFKLLGRSLDTEALVKVLTDIGSDVYRAKGFLPSQSGDGMHYFDWTPGLWNSKPAPDVAMSGGYLVVIGHKNSEPSIWRSVGEFIAGSKYKAAQELSLVCAAK